MLLQNNIFIKNKKLIFSVFIIFVLVSAVIGGVKEKRWTSSATITISNNIKSQGNFLPLLYLDNKTENYNKLKYIYSNNNLYKEFIIFLNSNKNKSEFIKLENNSNLHLEDIIITRKSNDNTVISITTSNKKESKMLVYKYIDFTSSNAKNYVLKDYSSTMSQLKYDFNNLLEKENEKAKNKVSIEIKRLKAAYEIASLSNNKEAINNYSPDNILPAFLGTRIIKNKIKYLENIKDYEIIIPEIMIVKDDINILNKAKIPTKVVPVFFSYQEKPTLPLVQNKPTFKVIIFFGVIFGFLSSLLLVFVKEQVIIQSTGKTND
ncbi:Wzz/FepE/Etk N-terminal domain-containing protein [Photobacterium kishitanii]|uniref:Wzz/FepE/Etk N-terminal domain-containing protein n=1 Tax=Photobacterium kishitanii TaxID=318456 RepID=UPI0011B22880|nr:Wzz/FepE/Etk N-terminal domain-containing protein [Photobacterium kishitanii]